jgi:hypothetical protein
MINALTGDGFDSDFRKFLRAIDALLMCNVLDKTLTAPPGSPTNGDAHIVHATGTGAWSGHDNAIAIWTTDNPAAPSGEWEFYAAANGLVVFNVADTTVYFWNGSTWTAIAGGGGSSTLAGDTDVLISSPANNDVLTYETSSTKWKNKPAAGGGGGGALFSCDGDSLSGYTIVGTIAAATVSTGTSPHNYQKTIFASPNGCAYKSTGLTSLAGMVIECDIAADGASGFADLFFGANASGVGPVFRVYGGGGSGSGIGTSASFASVATGPSPGDSLSASTWYRIKILINAGGTQATWYINGVAKGQVAITLSGDYVAFFGDGGSNGGYFANLRIYPS